MCSCCMRMAIPCFGYRNSRFLAIRDETSRVTEKARRGYARAAKKEREQMLAVWSPLYNKAQLLPESIPLPLEATAIGYFFSVFSRSGTFAYLPEYATLLVQDDSITQALCAAALGSMAIQYGNDALSHSARRYYTASLMCTNRDLRERKSTILDSTLLRVLMLSAFEALDLHEGGQPENWAAHIEGSSRLLLMRGKEQLRTPFGRLLFHHAGVNILVHSIIKGVSLPVELLRLFGHAVPRPAQIDFASTYILSLLLQMAALAPEIWNMNASDLLKKVLLLDEQAREFLKELSVSTPFQVINIANSSDEHQHYSRIHTYGGIMHLYQDQQTARLYNTARLLRLSLKQWTFIAVINSSGVDEPTQILGTDNNRIEDRAWMISKILSDSAHLVKDVLASVPYSLDLLDSQNSTEARYLIWPLARIASLDICPISAKCYISDRFTALARKFHLRRAMEAAMTFEQGDQAHSW
jgi:hypothetical protein